MSNKLLLAAAAGLALAGCQNVMYEGRTPAQSLDTVNVPVVTQQLYSYDVPAPGGIVSPAAASQLGSWFASLGLSYGDRVYVDGPLAGSAAQDVAQIASGYGLFLADSAPVTEGAIPAGAVRVVVGRATASVPNCPHWPSNASPNPQNESMPGYGCAVQGALSQMIANPNDLVYGRASTDLTRLTGTATPNATMPATATAPATGPAPAPVAAPTTNGGN